MRQTITRSVVSEALASGRRCSYAYGKPCVPGTTVTLLSEPGKMPGYGYGLPAVRACPGAFFGANAICGHERSDSGTSCYATTGRYAFDGTLNAQAARFAWTRACLRTVDGRALWVATMVDAITWASRRSAFFRWHDSGDVFSAAYGDAIADVIAATPDVKHWLPNRSWRVPAILPSLQRIAMLENVAVKPSALHFEELPPVILGLDAGTSASEHAYTCPALDNGGKCGDCRACWGKTTATVYPYHGRDVHGIATAGSTHHKRSVTAGGRDARLVAFLAQWSTHFATSPVVA